MNQVPFTAFRLRVVGRVQGVGFRPFVARLARQCGLGGHVRNAADAVIIELEGPSSSVTEFQRRLTDEQPQAACIETVTVGSLPLLGRRAFTIEASDPAAQRMVRVPPDTVTCAECLHDLLEPSNRRRHYAFTTCATCGPRYSIVTTMPYDRPTTAMGPFGMCPDCTREYCSPEDRRFHAQTNACSACGPQVSLWDQNARVLASSESAVSAAADLLRRGKIAALKGLGGFQLLVRADQTDAVSRLRERKHRPRKPLAVMVASAVDADEFAQVGTVERRLLESASGPIVLLTSKGTLCPEVAPGTNTLGVFLLTTPLHHLLLSAVRLPVVATSGNLGDEPLVIDEHEALQRLANIADAFLIHDRPIVRRLDDSVVRVIAGQPVVLRLGRGYAPLPLPALEEQARRAGCPPNIALGGQQKTALALWTGTQAILTQHVGDLGNPETRAALDQTANDLMHLYQCDPLAVACDLHPDYYTTRWAASTGRPVVQVQHHHAHAVACMAEYCLLDREVLALTWDGTGFGPDGTAWGGEVLRATQTDFVRVASLLPFPLPGGEAAIRHPGRIAFGLLWQLLGNDALQRTELLQRIGVTPQQARLLAAMIQKNLRTMWTTSVGRLFDAVAALVLGIREAFYEGEAAIALEASADVAVIDAYPLPEGDWRPLLTTLLVDVARDVAPGTMAARFHNALVQWAGAVVRRQPLADVVLGGGCFQNRLLAERTIDVVQRSGRQVYLPSLVPVGDGGLAVGQLAVALGRFEKSCRGV